MEALKNETEIKSYPFSFAALGERAGEQTRLWLFGKQLLGRYAREKLRTIRKRLYTLPLPTVFLFY